MAGFKFFFNDGRDPNVIFGIVVFHLSFVKSPSYVIVIYKCSIMLIFPNDIDKTRFL